MKARFFLLFFLLFCIASLEAQQITVPDHREQASLLPKYFKVGTNNIINGIKSGSAVSVDEQDSLALVALYNATNGDDWANNDYWLSDSVYKWFGITVNSSGRVTQISLWDNGLKGQLPVEIGNLSELEQLILGENYFLTGNIPNTIGNLTALRVLNLVQNNFTGSIPESFSNLTALTELWLGHNSLSGNIDFIANLTNLINLSLYYNEFSGSIPNDIGNLISLQMMDLSNNNLSGQIPTSIGSLTSLWKLDLHNNQLSGEIPISIGNLTSLAYLDLQHNQLTGAIPSSIGSLNLLTELYLNNNSLTGTIPNEIGDLSSLLELSLYHNQLSGAIPDRIGDLTNLQKLYLYNNQLSGSIPSSIGNLTNLQFLYLNDNQLEGAVPATLNNLTSLRYLYLQNNQLDDLPDLSALTGLWGCYVFNNNFDFGDLETANIQVNYSYSPQHNIPITATPAGNQITLSFTVNGTNNQYQWYNLDTLLTGETSNSLTIDNTANGYYYCLITDNNFPNLTLKTEAQTVGPTIVSHGVLLEEYNALIALYDSTDGDNWNYNDKWKSSEEVDQWFGITVDSFHVTRISLHNNNLTGSIPPSIGRFEKLELLQLYNNNLTGEIPDSIGNLSSLKYLYLYSNRLYGNIPDAIGNLASLESLFLYNNLFTGNIPFSFSNLSSLRQLFLGFNQLSGEIPDFLGSLPELQVLDLSSNMFAGAVPDTLKTLMHLSDLYLQYNQLDELPDFSSSMALTVLYVNNNRFTFEDIEPNIEISTFVYFPQQTVGQVMHKYVPTGGRDTLVVTVGGQYNEYQWYKGYDLIPGATDSLYVIDNFDPNNQAGEYYCLITNTVATSLTLRSEPIYVYKTPSVIFTVTDGTDPIQGATVTLQGYGSQTTGEDGKAVFVSVIPSQNIPYSVERGGYLTASGNVDVTDTNDVNVTVALFYTSFDALPDEELRLFPNPATDYFIVRLPLGSLVEIYDYAGRKVYSGYSETETLRVDVSSWTSGIYIMRVRANDATGVKKILVK